MTRLAEKISSNHAQAATTQTQNRNSRRVIHRESTPQLVTVSESPEALDHPSHDAITLPVSLPPPVSHSLTTLSPLDLPAAQFRSGLNRRKENRQLLMEWVRAALVDGVDFGRVHIASKEKCEHARYGRVRECTNPYHWSKPSLFKPGAEKITGMLGITVHYPSLSAFEKAILAGVPITCIMLRCELQDAHARVVAEGVGARSLAQDYGDFNKSLKMAEKSAHIDATLRLAGLSEVFTQDLEDRPVMDEDVVSAPSSLATKPKAAPAATVKTVSGSPSVAQATLSTSDVVAPADVETELVSPEDVVALRERIKAYGFTEKRVRAWLYKTTQGTVQQFTQLSIAQCVSLLKKLEQWAITAGTAKAGDQP